MFALIVLLPMGALIWAGFRIVRNEEIVVQEQFRDLMEDRLQDVNINVSNYFEGLERSLQKVVALNTFDLDELRRLNRSEPRVLQLFVLNPTGELQYPNPMGELNSGERMFLLQAAKMFAGQDLKDAVLRAETINSNTTGLPATPDSANVNRFAQRSGEPQSRLPAQYNRQSMPETQRLQMPADVNEYADLMQAEQQPDQQQLIQQAYRNTPVQNLKAFQEASGWFVWYWDRGLNLIYWQRRPSGHIVGCALERARWMSDLITQLPETFDGSPGRDRSLETRVRLVNSSAAAVYQWGNYEPEDGQRPVCEVPLTMPLSSWRLQCFVPTSELAAGTGRSVYFSLFAGLAGIGVALAVTVFLFVREYSRDMKEAAQQVSFVNQVSHELKTPLTNIRMYAELLEQDLEDVNAPDAERPRRRLEIILSEGQRLSRLIGNVLTFARQKRQTLQLQPRGEIPDDLIQEIVDRFRPALIDQQIEVVFDADAGQKMYLDPDFLEQILGNLISNVEKYAGNGGLLHVVSKANNGVLTIDVRDAGAGIEPSLRKMVFEPFARVSNDLSYAAGTGIGLPIARELARLHGGDVVLCETDSGCCFRATLRDQKGEES